MTKKIIYMNNLSGFSYFIIYQLTIVCLQIHMSLSELTCQTDHNSKNTPSNNLLKAFEVDFIDQSNCNQVLQSRINLLLLSVLLSLFFVFRWSFNKILFANVCNPKLY